jgi:hypothetical protein
LLQRRFLNKISFLVQRFDFCVDLFSYTISLPQNLWLYKFFVNLKLFKFIPFICFLNQILIQIEKGKIKFQKKNIQKGRGKPIGPGLKAGPAC